MELQRGQYITLYAFMVFRAVKQAFICFRRNPLKLWQSTSAIVCFLSSSCLEPSWDHAQIWCREWRERDLQEVKCFSLVLEAKQSCFITACHSSCTNAALHPVTTKRKSHRSPCCSPSSGSFLSWFFTHTTQIDSWAAALGAVCSRASSRFLALLLLLPLTSALSRAYFGCRWHPDRCFTGHGFAPAANWSSAPLAAHWATRS